MTEALLLPVHFRLKPIAKIHAAVEPAEIVFARIQETVKIEIVQDIGAAVERIGEIEWSHAHIFTQMAKGLIDVAWRVGLLDWGRLCVILVGKLLLLLLGCRHLVGAVG